MNSRQDKIYCFDTDTFASAWRVHYRPETFATWWTRLESMIDAGQVLVPQEVKDEVTAGSDDLVKWVKKSCPKAVSVTMNQLTTVKEIVNKYPKVTHYHKPRPNHADPFVVAVAKEHNAVVVTYESKNGSQTNPSVPSLCEMYDIECINLSELFIREDISFTL